MDYLGWFRLKVPYKEAFKLSAEAVIVWGLIPKPTYEGINPKLQLLPGRSLCKTASVASQHGI